MRNWLAALLVVDVVDYSRLMSENERSAIKLIQALKDTHLEPKILSRNGEILKRMGDGWIAAFSSITSAVECAMQVQTDLFGNPLTKLRIGAHIGEIVQDDTDFYGAGVNLAARLQTEAPPGGLMVSEDLHRQLTGELARNFVDAGTFKLKNIALPINGFQWRPQEDGADRSSDVPTIAVELFDSAPDDTETRAAAADLHDQMIVRLSRRTGIRVIDEGTGSISECIYRLRARLRIAGDRGRLSLSLLLSKDSRSVFSQTYEGDTSNIFEFCDDLIDRADADLRLQINAFDGDRIADLPDDQLSVSELRSRAASQFYLTTFEGWQRFVDLVERALRLSPVDPMSLAMRAEGTVMLSAARQEQLDAAQVELLEDGFNKAIELAPRSDYVIWARGVFRVHVLGDAVLARHDIDRCIALNAAYPPAYEYLGLIHLMNGQYVEAAEALQKSVELSDADPLVRTRMYFHAASLLCAGELQLARDTIKNAIQLSSRPRNFHLLHAYCCRKLGDEAAAQSAENDAAVAPDRLSVLTPRIPLPDELVELRDFLSPV